MKNTIFNIIKYLYYSSLIVLIILYLYPGSLIGYFLYGSLGTQPNIISNPIGTSINHLIYFSLITVLSNIVKNRLKNLFTKTKFILFLSIFLELSHFIVPDRAFEFFDLIANIAGVLLIVILFRLFKS
tara:strand:- start:335 stop:718 length:384 start_codon:yes stop_codon:yes gene_type:complete